MMMVDIDVRTRSGEQEELVPRANYMWRVLAYGACVFGVIVQLLPFLIS